MATAAPSPPQVCPPLHLLDQLELARWNIWPANQDISVPVTAAEAQASSAAGALEVVDLEGVPLSRFGPADEQPEGGFAVRGVPQWLAKPSPRPFERLYRPPGEVRQELAPPSPTVVIDRPIHPADVEWLADLDAPLLLVLAGPSMAPTSRTLRMLRLAESVAERLHGASVAAVPLDADAPRDEIYESVVAAYAPGPVHSLSPRAEDDTPGGAVVFFTGLSGSGKSTVARAVRDTIVETQDRPVSLLDGDVVRRNLSAGLSFSPQDRDTNIRRIGWVAAEIGYHGGLAICSPIAPYDHTRDAVRAMVTEHGAEFLLVYVSTPVTECERRDRKGLYAKARAGEITDFTGVNAPYEVPENADLVLDTGTMSVRNARDMVLGLLRDRGHLRVAGAEEGADVWTL